VQLTCDCNLVGLDIAFISNGYVYHTPFDLPEMIPPGCIQRAGKRLCQLGLGLYQSQSSEALCFLPVHESCACIWNVCWKSYYRTC